MCDKERGTCHDSCCCVLPKRGSYSAMFDTAQAECASIMARDQKRAGRTTQAVQAAVLAAALGQRVAYVCGTQQLANDSCRIASDFIARSHVSTIAQGGRVSVYKDSITFYCDKSRTYSTGIVKFIGMGQEDRINLGVREEYKYRIVRDHHVQELLVEQERKKARRADADTIKHLLRKNGWGKVEDYGSGLTDTLVYRT